MVGGVNGMDCVVLSSWGSVTWVERERRWGEGVAVPMGTGAVESVLDSGLFTCFSAELESSP